MSKDSQTTVDHAEIRAWIEDRDGKPAVVKGTHKNGSGLLRVNFPGFAEDNLEDISWEEFFKIFDENDLEFLYQEETKEGKVSRFSKFVDRSS